jgi:serine/threonine protein kinase
MSKFPEIPGYKFMKLLGRGGMADVYLAVQKNLNRMVAIKVLIPSIFRDSLFLKRFKREAHTLSKLVHPNIITVYDVGKTGDSYYIVMEYLQESLKERLKAYRRGKPEEALLLIKQIAGSLFYAHRMGFIHRDIKPDNIMFRKDGTPVVLDFGIASPINASTKLTKTGMSIGTPSYISPEQAKGERVDGRSDIYSLGVVLYELLTGKVPYDAENTLGVILKHIEQPIPRLPSNLKKYQPLINRLMEKDRRKRVRTEEALNGLLKPLLDVRMVSETRPGKSKMRKAIEISDQTKEMSLPLTPSTLTRSSKSIPKKADSSPKSNKKKSRGQKIRLMVKTIFFFMVLALALVIALKYIRVGSDPRILDSDSVKSMIKRNNFYDRIWNRYGRFNNQFEKKISGKRIVIVDTTTGLMWYYSGSIRPMKHERVKGWVEWFNRQKFAGFGDWRLPTLKEAASLLTSANREDSLHINNIFSRTQKNIWTSNQYGINGAWVVRFDEGYMLGCPFDLENFIRPVRSLE